MKPTQLELVILRALRRSTEPLSGRKIAGIAGIAPNTANRVLKRLQERALVNSAKDGRANRWTSTAEVAELAEFEESPHRRVALVVTAVELEHTEVRNRLLNTARHRVGDIPMVRGEVPGEHIDWTVYLARAGMGNATSAALVGLAAGELQANLVAFVGIAAGLKPADQRHLDVVVASQIHNPYVGKQIPTEAGSMLLGRERSYRVPAPLLAVVNAYVADSEWTPSTRNEHHNAKHSHAFVAPIVSVEAVQSDLDGPVIQEVRTRFQDAAALDMESYGLAAGADIHDLPVLAIRGISDFIGDKAEPGNDDRQPLAAGNAAALLSDLLAWAHPDDFKRGPSSGQSGVLQDHGEFDDEAMPQTFRIWVERLEHRSADRARAARQMLAELRGTAIATRLNQMLHRPPAWLREDDTGDGWALVACLASWSQSKVAGRAFDKAADAATLTGDLDAKAFFTVSARLEDVSRDLDQQMSGDQPRPNQSALGDLDDDVLCRLGPVIDVYRAVLDQDLAKAKDTAEVAVASLGLEDPNGVLLPPAEHVTVVELDPDLRDLVAVAMLRQLAVLMLAPGAADQLGVQSGLAARALRGNPVTRDMADDGMKLARWALELRPGSEGARLTLAQTTLGVLVSTAGRGASEVNDAISQRAREVENEAMSVRDAFNEWGGPTGSALAVAARARSMQGDFAGALRMLRPAPDGVASRAESQHPEAIRLAAYIARASGDDELALELAAQNPNRTEAELMRAAVLDERPEMAREATAALIAALESSGGDHHDKYQALMALSRRFNSLKEIEKSTVTECIAILGELDPDLAEVMRARVHLSEGDPHSALVCIRGVEPTALALETHADALTASNRAEDAAHLVFTEGLRRGDIPLATAALEHAMDNGLTTIARDFARQLLTLDGVKAVRLRVLRALQHIADNEAAWFDVESWTVQVIEELQRNGLPVAEIEYWLRARALYFQDNFVKALQVLMEAPGVSFHERWKAHLFLSILRRTIDEHRTRADLAHGRAAGLQDPSVYAMFMRAAADWADDEEIAAAAMSVALTTPESNFTEIQVADVRAYTERYFERHGENATITRLNLANNNLDPLVDLLRAGEARQLALEDLADEVRAGRFPLAALAEAAGRTTTEVLIRRDLGCILAVEDDAGLGEQTARAALESRVVVDTTALVVAPWAGRPFNKLAANFDAVILPAPLREDIARARTALAMKSTATLGWDSRAQKPAVTTTSAEIAEEYAAAAEQVWRDAQKLRLSPAPTRDPWQSAIAVAQELGVPVWADDVVIRRLARAVGVGAFGSLDLIRVLGTGAENATAMTGLRANRVVDLVIDQTWRHLVEHADWRIDSPFALAISRPAAWQNKPESFVQFQSMIRHRSTELDPKTIADWAHIAANGLALATAASTRHRAVSALLAWTILAADPFFTVVDAVIEGAPVPEKAGRTTELIISAADALHARHYPAADALALIVDILCSGLLDTVGPEATSRIVAALVKHLDRDTGTRVFAAYIQSAGK
ncbi:phosphorylase family protein [Nocardia salmonicida]